MSSSIALLVIAAIAGIAVALQGQFMGVIDRTAGTRTSVFITYGMGAMIAALLWLPRRTSLETIRQIPPYAWSAGALGLIIVGGIGYAAPRLGLASTLVVTIAAQLVAALIIDHLGLFTAQQRPIDVARALGLFLTVLGAWLVVRP
ncbi:MAG TPA: DMT family transporter [Thermoanaerobaculia bacterium]